MKTSQSLLRGCRKAILSYNLSVCFADSSPDRGAPGESVMVVLDERSFSHPGTVGLRCRDSRLLARHPLSERSSAAAAHSDRARRFAPDWAYANSRADPACQWLPYQGSWREAPERLYKRTLSRRFALPFVHLFSPMGCFFIENSSARWFECIFRLCRWLHPSFRRSPQNKSRTSG